MYIHQNIWFDVLTHGTHLNICFYFTVVGIQCVEFCSEQDQGSMLIWFFSWWCYSVGSQAFTHLYFLPSITKRTNYYKLCKSQVNLPCHEVTYIDLFFVDALCTTVTSVRDRQFKRECCLPLKVNAPWKMYLSSLQTDKPEIIKTTYSDLWMSVLFS